MTSYRYGLFAFFFRWVTLGLATWHLARAKSEDGGVFSGSTSACAACKEEYMPVCTSFGILVLNACVAECQGLSVGPCPGTEAPHRGATDLFTTEERATGGQERQAFLASGAPIPRDVLFRLREEGYFFVGRQAVSPQFNAIPRRDDASQATRSDMGTTDLSHLTKRHLVSVLLPEGYVYVNPDPEALLQARRRLEELPSRVAGTPSWAADGPDLNDGLGQAQGGTHVRRRGTHSRGQEGPRERHLRLVGKDNRKEVPGAGGVFNHIFYMTQQRNGSMYQCTGSMVGRAVAVTAAHCLFDPDTNTWASEVTIFHGAFQGFFSDTAGASRFFAFAGWTRDGDYAWDFAIMFVDAPLGDALGYFSIQQNCGEVNISLTLAGYPGDKQPFTMWKDTCLVSFARSGASCLATNWDHTCDTTEGSSGSPMWDAAGNLRAVHVVSYRSKELNAATPLRKEMQDAILAARLAWDGSNWYPSNYFPAQPPPPSPPPPYQRGAPIRLIHEGAVHPSKGRIELWMNGVWGTVCDDFWDNDDAMVVCRRLGYPHGVARRGGFFPPGTGPIYLDNVGCVGNETDILDCAFEGDTSDCSHTEDAGVECHGAKPLAPTLPPLAPPSPPAQPKQPVAPIRLMNFTSQSSRIGRVEVLINGTWGTVCDDFWSDEDAAVVCRQLGFAGGRAFSEAFFGAGDGPIALDDVACSGTEDGLLACPHDADASDCSHAEDAGVECLDWPPPSPPSPPPLPAYPPAPNQHPGPRNLSSPPTRPPRPPVLRPPSPAFQPPASLLRPAASQRPPPSKQQASLPGPRSTPLPAPSSASRSQPPRRAPSWPPSNPVWRPGSSKPNFTSPPRLVAYEPRPHVSPPRPSGHATAPSPVPRSQPPPSLPRGQPPGPVRRPVSPKPPALNFSPSYSPRPTPHTSSAPPPPAFRPPSSYRLPPTHGSTPHTLPSPPRRPTAGVSPPNLEVRHPALSPPLSPFLARPRPPPLPLLPKHTPHLPPSRPPSRGPTPAARLTWPPPPPPPRPPRPHPPPPPQSSANPTPSQATGRRQR